MLDWQIQYIKELNREQERFDYLYTKAVLHYKDDGKWLEKLLYINPKPFMTFKTENDCLDSGRYFYTYWHFLSCKQYYWEFLSD